MKQELAPITAPGSVTIPEERTADAPQRANGRMAAGGAPHATTPLVDEAQIAALRDALGEQDLDAMLSHVPGAVWQALHRINAAVEENDLETVRRAAHALKGVAGNFAAARLAAVARDLEIEPGPIDTLAPRIEVLTETIVGTLALLPSAGSRHVAGPMGGSGSQGHAGIALLGAEP